MYLKTFFKAAPGWFFARGSLVSTNERKQLLSSEICRFIYIHTIHNTFCFAGKVNYTRKLNDKKQHHLMNGSF